MFWLLGSLHVAPARGDGAAAEPPHAVLREVAGQHTSLGIRPAREKAAMLD